MFMISSSAYKCSKSFLTWLFEDSLLQVIMILLHNCLFYILNDVYTIEMIFDFTKED